MLLQCREAELYELGNFSDRRSLQKEQNFGLILFGLAFRRTLQTPAPEDFGHKAGDFFRRAVGTGNELRDLHYEAPRSHGAVALLEQAGKIGLFPCRALKALAGDARPAVAAELAIFRCSGVIAVEIGRRKVL